MLREVDHIQEGAIPLGTCDRLQRWVLLYPPFMATASPLVEISTYMKITRPLITVPDLRRGTQTADVCDHSKTAHLHTYQTMLNKHSNCDHIRKSMLTSLYLLQSRHSMVHCTERNSSVYLETVSRLYNNNFTFTYTEYHQ